MQRSSTTTILYFICITSCVYLHTTPAFSFDISALCRKAAMADATTSLRGLFAAAPDLHLGMDADDLAVEIYQRFGQDPSDELGAVPAWYLLFSPQLTDRIAAHKLQTFYAQEAINRQGETLTVAQTLEKFAHSPLQYSEAAINAHRSFMNAYYSRPPYVTPLQQEGLIDLACTTHPFLNCRKALADLVTIMDVQTLVMSRWSHAAMSLPDVIDDIFINPIYRQAAARLAIKIQNKIDNIAPTDTDAHIGNVFSDAIQSFLETGIDYNSARLFALRLLGFYGTRGASMRLLEEGTSRESWSMMTSLYIISTGMSVLDLYAAALTPYSYADRVTSSCTHGRPYHFWLSAYLTQRLVALGYNSSTAVKATHLIGSAYEFGGDRVGMKDNSHIYFGEFFNPLNISTQQNIAINDLGAQFGAGINQLSLDNALLKIFQHAKPMPALSPDTLKTLIKLPGMRYRWYQRVIAPDAYAM